MSRPPLPAIHAVRKRAAALVLAQALALSGGVALLSASPAQSATKYVYLTFDDGPSSRYTPQVLDILASHHASATFFELGENIQRYPSLTRRAHRAGNSIQNHTWSHPDLRQVSWTTFKSQVTNTDSRIRAQTGYTPKCLRPPYGDVNSTVRSRAAALGKQVVLWTVDPRDWSRPGTSSIISRVLNNVRNGSIILMHDGGGDRSQTVAALPKILNTLKTRGYTFYRLWCR